METRPETLKTVDVFVFYFDLAHVVSQFLDDQQGTLKRLRAFQRAARHTFPFAYKHSYIATLFDNVWCRVNAAQPGLPSLLLNFAGTTMQAARDEGFKEFFGCIARGSHEYCPDDRQLVGSESFEDLNEQHLDMTSEPHIRAAYSEKWRQEVAAPPNSVWVSSEVLKGTTIAGEASYPDCTFSILGDSFDLAQVCRPNAARWPFTHQSQFQAIGPRGGI